MNNTQANQANDAISKNATVQQANSFLSPGMEVSLFDCLSDVVGFGMSCCCSCIVAGFNAAHLDDRECTPCDILSNDYQTRQALRTKYNMGYAPLQDFAAMYWCGCCFVMQTAKEIALKKGDEPIYLGEVGMNIMGDRPAAPPANTTGAASGNTNTTTTS